MAYPYSRKKRTSGQVPKGGWKFMGQITDLVIDRARESGLLAELDSVRYTPAGRGRPIYYSNESMLRAVVLKFLMNKRYFSYFADFLELDFVHFVQVMDRI